MPDGPGNDRVRPGWTKEGEGMRLRRARVKESEQISPAANRKSALQGAASVPDEAAVWVWCALEGERGANWRNHGNE